MKKIQKYFIVPFISILLVLFVSGTINNFNIFKSDLSKSVNRTNMYSIDSSYLEDEVETLVLSANLSDETISYDITFNGNDYDGLKVVSIFYVMDETPWVPFIKTVFDGSEETIEKGHASNTTSYTQIYDYEDVTDVISSDSVIRVSVLYQQEENGEFIAANKQPIGMNLHKEWSPKPFKVNDSQTTMTAVKDDSYGRVTFSFSSYTSSLHKIKIKSNRGDNLNQEIYNSDESTELIDGSTNTIGFTLQKKQWYRDLYLEFTFVDADGVSYVWDSPINDFKPIHTDTLSTTTIILLIVVILLIIITLIFIFFIFKQMKKRKELEKQQDQAYYDENYEDGMN